MINIIYIKFREVTGRNRKIITEGVIVNVEMEIVIQVEIEGKLSEGHYRKHSSIKISVSMVNFNKNKIYPLWIYCQVILTQTIIKKYLFFR